MPHATPKSLNVGQMASEFRPESDEEMLEIMNFLDERLRSTNAAILVATVKVLLNISAYAPTIHQQVIERTKVSSRPQAFVLRL